jgi:hypothetical protein
MNGVTVAKNVAATRQHAATPCTSTCFLLAAAAVVSASESHSEQLLHALQYIKRLGFALLPYSNPASLILRRELMLLRHRARHIRIGAEHYFVVEDADAPFHTWKA